MKLISVIWSFLKIGTIGFGGGSALIPVVEREIVENKKWKSEDEYTRDTIIANITPGALPVKLGALWHSKFSVVSAFCVALPGTLALLVLLACFSLLDESAVIYIEYASVLVSCFILYLLGHYIIHVYDRGVQEGVKNSYILIFVIAFLLTCGKEVYQLLNLEGAPLLDLSALNLMILTFFIVLFMGDSKSKIRLVLACTISAVFIYANSKNGLSVLNWYVAPLMTAMVCWSIFKDKAVKKQVTVDWSPVKNIVLFVIVSALLFGIVYLTSPKEGAGGFLGTVALSSVSSFGGGEAYVAVADGFFVQNGYIQPNVYYSQVVAIANALPGPILVKVASGVGFIYGSSLGGMWFGFLLGLSALAITVCISSIGALIVLIGFDSLHSSPRLMMLKRYVLPVVCGMLMSVMLSMVHEMIKILF